MAKRDAYIVAEIRGCELTPESGVLAEQFARVLAHYQGLGHRLLEFHVHRMMTGPDDLNETIIAVFERADPAPAAEP